MATPVTGQPPSNPEHPRLHPIQKTPHMPLAQQPTYSVVLGITDRLIETDDEVSPSARRFPKVAS
jgi:hypothetical protein